MEKRSIFPFLRGTLPYVMLQRWDFKDSIYLMVWLTCYLHIYLTQFPWVKFWYLITRNCFQQKYIRADFQWLKRLLLKSSTKKRIWYDFNTLKRPDRTFQCFCCKQYEIFFFFFLIRIIAKTGLLLIYHFFDVYFYCDSSCNQTILTRLLLFNETPTGNRALL